MRKKAPRKTVKIVSPPGKSFGSAENSAFLAPRYRRTVRSTAGKGLGKAGARRLGQMLKRAFPSQAESARANLSLPKTPFRLFKHQIQNTRVTGAQASVPERASPHITQLILSLVSQCKHKGGMSMAELKHTLSSEGYDVAKNNKHVTVTKQLLNNGKLVQSQHKLNKPSEIIPQMIPIKKEAPKTRSSNTLPQPTKPKSTSVTSKTPKKQTQARRSLKTTQPESKRSKSIKRKVKSQTRTQKRRAKTTKGRPKRKATKRRRVVSTKRKRTVKTPKRQNPRKTHKSKTAKQKHNSRERSEKQGPGQRNVKRNRLYC